MSLEHLPVLMKKTQMSGERAQCGLTSLLPMSCRGRAEAFARRLHTRLRSLGSQAGASADPEGRWLGTAPGPRHDSELFFDFELECESPSSPVDEYEAPYLDRSPSDDGDAPFYDVDAEPLDRDGETAPRVNGDAALSKTNGFTFTSVFYTDRSPIKCQPAPRENGTPDGRLYSAITFDDCERVEQSTRDGDEVDAVALRLSPSEASLADISLTAPAMHSIDSDSDFESAKSDTVDTADEALEIEIENVDDNVSLPSDRLSELSLRLEDPSSENDHIEISPVIEDAHIQVKDQTDFDQCEIENSSSNSLEISKEDAQEDKETSPIAEPERESVTTPTTEEEDDRPQRVRRCSSLKTGKTPPGTPGRKKIVRFADVLGLDLADVKTFMDDIPVIPKSAYEDLSNADVAVGSPPTARPPSQVRPGALSLVPLFQTPRDVAEGLQERCVCLESARVADGAHIAVCGTARVRNLDFHKTVHIRYTMDGWRTYTDLQATYVPGSCDGFSDRFTFTLYAPAIAAGQRLELAVRFQCKGRQYWDNNFNANYCFDCLPLGVPAVAALVSAPLHPTRDWHPSFY